MAAIQILMIEDTDGDARLAELAFREMDFKYSLLHLNCGIKAISHLRAAEEHQIPHVILIDVNMHKATGCMVAETLRTIEKLENVFIIMTSTGDCGLIESCCSQIGANAFLYKSMDFETYFLNLKNILSANGYLDPTGMNSN